MASSSSEENRESLPSILGNIPMSGTIVVCATADVCTRSHGGCGPSLSCGTRLLAWSCAAIVSGDHGGQFGLQQKYLLHPVVRQEKVAGGQNLECRSKTQPTFPGLFAHACIAHGLAPCANGSQRDRRSFFWGRRPHKCRILHSLPRRVTWLTSVGRLAVNIPDVRGVWLWIPAR